MTGEGGLEGHLQDPLGVVGNGGGGSGNGGGGVSKVPVLSAETVGAIPRGICRRSAPRSI